RSIIGNLGATVQTFFGGNITLYSELCEKSREDAFELMLVHAAQIGANAVIGMRYDATEIQAGVTEVLAYGTAVVVGATAERGPGGGARQAPRRGPWFFARAAHGGCATAGGETRSPRRRSAGAGELDGGRQPPR